MTIQLYQEQLSRIHEIYSAFKNETTRRRLNNDKIIIPSVSITGKTFEVIFENVTVTAHNLRNDVFKLDVITAMDVIMTPATVKEFGLKPHLAKRFTRGAKIRIKNFCNLSGIKRRLVSAIRPPFSN